MVGSRSRGAVVVRPPGLHGLRELLAGPDVSFEPAERGAMQVKGLTAEQIGDLAAGHAIAIHELTPQQASLEEAFMNLTRDDVEFGAHLEVAPAEVAA